jgi:hypothetical protein
MAITVPIITDFQSKGVKEAEDAFTKLKNKSGKAFKAIGLAATAAAGAVAAGLGASVKAAVEDEQAQVKLAKAIKNSANANDDQIQSIEDLISKMALATGVADDKLRPAYQKLITATGDVERANKLLAVANDASAATGKDLESVAVALAKAENGQYAALKKLGIPMGENITALQDQLKFSKAVAKAQNEYNYALENEGPKEQAKALAKLEEAQRKLNDVTKAGADYVLDIDAKFKGAAETAANTTAGRFERLKVTMGEIAETAGSALLPALNKLTDFAAKTVIPAFQKLATVFEEEGFSGVAKAIGNSIREQGPEVLKALGEVLRAMGTWIANEGLPMLGEKLKMLKDAFTNWIKESSPDALKNLGKFLGDLTEWILTKGVPKLIEATAKLSIALLKWLVEIGPDLLKGLALFAAEFVKGLIDTIIESFKGLAGKGLELGKAFANALIGVINKQVIGRINDLLEFKVGPVKINPPDIPNIPELANGGIVTGPTVALIGEAGPEAVVPLDRMGGMGNNIVINVNGGDPNQVVEALKKYVRSNGTLPSAIKLAA